MRGKAFVLLCGWIACHLDGLAQEAVDLPLKRLALFSSGVGYFELDGKVKGNADFQLRFHADDINDLLKSLVLEDRGDGRVATVTYGAKNPVAKTLKSFAIDLSKEPTIADLMRQARGEMLLVDAGAPIRGRIVGVEVRPRVVNKDIVEVETLNLLTESGLKSVAIETITSAKFADEKLNAEFQEVLLVLAQANSTEKKTVTIRFLGDGERSVRVGYIQEAPVWKTTYRLVLRDGAPPHLQGWAIVENTTDKDWRDVRLSLLSGRPISFVMDLYQPLYADRPLVPLQLSGSPAPRVHDQDLAEKARRFVENEEIVAQGRRRRDFALGGGAGGKSGVERRFPEADGGMSSGVSNGISRTFDATKGVLPAVRAQEVGELFRYDIEDPVTLPRQQSAMLPIVNRPITGEKVSVFNPSSHAKHPLNAVLFTNTTHLHLLQGPLTLFDDGVYAGDGRIEDLAPGAKRLVSYALDLDTEVSRRLNPTREQTVALALANNVVSQTIQTQRSETYTVRNSSTKAKKVLIERPIEGSWVLVKPDRADETTRSEYRFAVTAEPGKTLEFTVVERLESVKMVEVINQRTTDAELTWLANHPSASPKLRQALSDIQLRRGELAKLEATVKLLSNRRDAISTEQTRIRENMKELDRTGELYQRYVKKLASQEDELESLSKEIEKRTKELTETKQQFDRFLDKLEVK